MNLPVYDFARLHPHLKDLLPADAQRPNCPRCDGSKFYQGPRGGTSTNVLCANIECRHWFNHMPGFGLDEIGRIEPRENMDG